MRARSLTLLTAGLCVAASLVGCEFNSSTTTAGVDPNKVKELQTAFTLADEPTEVMGIEELRDKLIADNKEDGKNEETISTQPVDVTLLGRIGGVVDKNNPTFPWEKDKASFVMCDPAAAAELAEHVEAHGGEDHDCPFCNKAKEKAALAQAYVQFQDAGETVEVDARKLFELSGEELVVIQGKAKLTVGMLMVDANKIYVRR